MKKINVCIATNILDIGGAERTVQTLALQLNKTEFDVTVLCLLRGGPRVSLLEEHGARVLVGDGTLEKIKTLLPNPNFDVLHFHRSGQNELPLHAEVVAYLKPKKLMETNIFALEDPILGSKFDLHAYKSLMMLCERVWRGPMPALNQYLLQRVIYNPVTVEYFEQFKLSDTDRENQRLSLGIGPNDIVFGRVGRNDTTKWGDLVLSAMPKILAQNPQAKFVFRTVPDARLTWLKKNNFFGGRVIVLPESKDEREIAATYQLFDVCIHTSRRGEAFGNSLNEAMVWSLPIIVENTPHWDNGQLEQVENGVTGWVVKSVGGLVAAAQNLIDDSKQRNAFATAGNKKVREQFGWHRGISQYELAYKQLVGVVTSDYVQQNIYPTVEQLEKYHAQYQAIINLDFPHRRNFAWSIHSWATYWYWRVGDSLRSRGLLSI